VSERRPSIASVIRTVQAAGLVVAEVVVEPGGFRVLTGKPKEALSEIERAREARRARKADGAPHHYQDAG